MESKANFERDLTFLRHLFSLYFFEVSALLLARVHLITSLEPRHASSAVGVLEFASWLFVRRRLISPIQI